MATYAELKEIVGGGSLNARVAIACVVEADVIRQELATVTDHDKRMAWAKAALEGPEQMAAKIIWAVLAQNRSATVAQITSSTDAQLQAAVSAAVVLLL